MQNNYLLLALLCTCSSFFTPTFLQAQQLIWGHQAPIGQAAGEFQNAFINTTIAGNYSPTAWTARSVSDSIGGRIPGAAFWTRDTIGYSQGAFASAMFITSATATNGVAIFDSDFLDCAGTRLAFGTGTSPAIQRGELISPRIDLSAVADSALVLSFHSHYRYFMLSELSVAYSQDDGVTWSAPIDIAALQPTTQNAPVQGRVRILLADWTKGAINLSQCRLKFTFEGEYYFSMLDDLSLEISPAYDLAIGLADPTASSLEEMGNIIRMGGNAHQVWDNIGFYSASDSSWSWGAKVVNKGAKDILPSQRPRLYCSVSVTDVLTGFTYPYVYLDSMIYLDTLFSGDKKGRILAKNRRAIDLNFLINQSYNTKNRYTVHYWTAHDGVDGVATNDSISYSFVVARGVVNSSSGRYEGLYVSKARLATGDGRVQATAAVFPPDGPYVQVEYGSVYYFPWGGADELRLDSIDFRYYLTANFSGADTQTIFAGVYEYNDGTYGEAADGVIQSGEVTMIGLDVSVLTGLGTTQARGQYHLATFGNLVDAATGVPLGTLKDQTFYYISTIISPSLTGGVFSFGIDEVPIHGVDQLNYALNISKSTTLQPFAPSTLGVLDTLYNKTWTTGLAGHNEVPSIGIFYSRPRYLISTVLVEGHDLKGSLSIAPNPASTILQVDLKLEQQTEVQYIITDPTGRVVYYDKSNNIQQETMTIDVSTLAAGVYIVTAKTATGTLNKRFVKQ